MTPGGSETRSTPLYFSHAARSGIIDGNWKGVAQDDPQQDPFEVYDLSKDPSELNNVASSEPGIQTSLRDAWFAWAHENNVKDWPVSGLPGISITIPEEQLLVTETGSFSLQRDSGSGSNTVTLEYSGSAVQGYHVTALPDSVPLTGTTPADIPVDPLAPADATDSVDLDIPVTPNFWYLEPAAPGTIHLNLNSFEAWATEHLSDETGIHASAFGNPDGDDYVNFEEYWMGSNPRAADLLDPSAMKFAFDPETGTQQLHYQMGLNSNEIGVRLEFTEDLLSPWRDQSEMPFEVQKTRSGDIISFQITLDGTALAEPAYFARLQLEWLGGAVGDPLLSWLFVSGSDQASGVLPGISAGAFNPRSAFFSNSNSSGISSSNETSYIRSTETGTTLEDALNLEHYHEVEMDFSSNPTDLISLEFEHKASADTAFTSTISVFASTDGFATDPTVQDVLGSSTVAVPAGQSPLTPLDTVEFSFFGPEIYNQFDGTLTLRFYYHDDINSDSGIHRLDSVTLYGF